jgi:galactose mutarotase-like enzyme
MLLGQFTVGVGRHPYFNVGTEHGTLEQQAAPDHLAMPADHHDDQ